MSKKILLLLLIPLLLLAGCSSDDDKFTESMFGTDPPARNSFDEWLIDNFVYSYNVELQYRLKDIETHFIYHRVPADVDASKKMGVLIKHMFLESYQEVAGIDFIRTNAPRVIVLVGDGEDVRGTAEGGLKVILYNINNIAFTYEYLSQTYFKTLHHEFQHILNTKRNYPEEYEQISGSEYAGAQYSTYTLDAALQSGFISAYAMSYVGEDVADMIGWHTILTAEQWEARIGRGGENGMKILNRKLAILKEYMQTSFDIDIDELRDVNVRRMNEFDYLGLDDLNF